MTPAERRAALDALGLTQSQAAPLLGYGTQARVSDFVSGKVNPPAVVRLLQAYLDGYRPADWPLPVTR